MRGPVTILFGLALVAAVCGCRSCDRVESELRARENDVRELKEALEGSQAHNLALQTELQALRGEPTPLAANVSSLPVYPVRTLVLGRQTGGSSESGAAGDDSLLVILEPHDAEGQSVKVSGSALIQVLEVLPEGLKRPLSTWQITPDQLRHAWRTGLLSTGYRLVMPWKIWPSTEKLRVVAQLRLDDGRTFEADRDVTVHLPPAQKRPPMPPASDSIPELPMPSPAPPPETAAPRNPPVHTASAKRATAPVPPWNNPRTPVVQPAAEILRPVPLEDNKD